MITNAILLIPVAFLAFECGQRTQGTGSMVHSSDTTALLLATVAQIDSGSRPRIVAHLADGSQIVGVPGCESISVRTPYGNLDLPFADLLTIQFVSDGDSVVVSFLNGDKVHGHLAADLCRIVTLIGDVTLMPRDLTSIVIRNRLRSIDDGLIGYFPFNGNAHDESGNSHHGSLNGGVTWIEDRFRRPQQAAHFNGTDAFISVADPARALNFEINTQSYSISCWARLDPLLARRDAEILMDRGTNDNGPCSYDILFRGSTGRFVANAWDGRTNIIVPSETKAVANTWYHLVMVVDTREVRLFVNGTRELSADGAANARAIPNNFMPTRNDDMARTIGDFAPAWFNGHHYFTGAIDDIRIYKRVLSEAEISSLYHEGGW